MDVSTLKTESRIIVNLALNDFGDDAFALMCEATTKNLHRVSELPPAFVDAMSSRRAPAPNTGGPND